MIISTNGAGFRNPGGTSGLLLADGMAFHEDYMVFKPAAVVKKRGFLKVAITGSVYGYAGINFTLTTRIFQGATPMFDANHFLSVPMTTGEHYFSSEMHIPVGTASMESGNYIITSHIDSNTHQYQRAGSLPAGPDDMYRAALLWTMENTENGYGPNGIDVKSIIVTYLEN